MDARSLDSQVLCHLNSVHASAGKDTLTRCIPSSAPPPPHTRTPPPPTSVWRLSFSRLQRLLGEIARSGAAKRRRERRLRQWHRRERLTVHMALCEALHHAAPQVQRGENSAQGDRRRTRQVGGRAS